MPMSRNIAQELRRVPELREIPILARIGAPRLTEIEQEEEHRKSIVSKPCCTGMTPRRG